MITETQFYHSPKRPHATRDWWFLIENGDGSVHVLHKWNYPETASGVYKAGGEARFSVQEFLREEGSDTAKQRLRVLLEAKGQKHGGGALGLPGPG